MADVHKKISPFSPSVLLLCLPLAAYGSLLYAGAGTTSASFLQENLSARQVGMGGVFAASADDSSAMNSNPAGLSLIQRPEVNLSYASALDNGRHGFFGYVHPVLKEPAFQLGVGAGIRYFNAGNIDVNYADGTTRSFVAETGYAGILSFGGRVQKWFAFGMSPKFVRSALVEQYEAAMLAVDMGIMLFPFPELTRERFSVGAAVQNLGPKFSYKSAQHDLPRTDSAALSVRFFDLEDYGAVSASAQIERVHGEKFRYRVGSEYALGGQNDLRVVFLRAGYRLQFESENYSIGVGFRERNFQVDYAFVNSSELEKTHRFTLLFRFGKFLEKKESLKYELINVEKEMKATEKSSFEKKEEKQDNTRYDLIDEKKESKTETFILVPKELEKKKQ